jgi:hypothetical protein
LVHFLCRIQWCVLAKLVSDVLKSGIGHPAMLPERLE